MRPEFAPACGAASRLEEPNAEAFEDHFNHFLHFFEWLHGRSVLCDGARHVARLERLYAGPLPMRSSALRRGQRVATEAGAAPGAVGGGENMEGSSKGLEDSLMDFRAASKQPSTAWLSFFSLDHLMMTASDRARSGGGSQLSCRSPVRSGLAAILQRRTL